MSFSKPFVTRLNPRAPPRRGTGSGQVLFSAGLPHNKVAALVTNFFCSDFEESGAMQRMALFLDLARKRLTKVIVTEHQRLRRGRPPTESTTVGWDGDACDGGELRWGDGSRDTTLAALEDTYYIHN